MKARSLFWIFLCVVFFAVFFHFFFIQKVLAVTVTLSDIPSTITTDPFALTASVSGAQAGTNYLKIDLFKDGSQNYFGETNTPNGWYGGFDGVQTYPITIITNAPWSGSIQGKLGTPSITQYDGQGIYKLRVRRYTSSGSSYITSDAVTVVIAVPTQTPTPTITPTPTDVPTPTRTPTPIKTPTPLPDENTPTISTKVSPKTSPTGVLGDSTESASFDLPTVTPIETPTSTPKTEVAGVQKDWVPLICIIIGVFFVLAYGILTFRPQLLTFWEKIWKK